MQAFRIIKWIFLVLGVCFLLAIPVTGISLASANWQGMCYGFTDSQLPCSWWEFAKNEMFWKSLMFIPWSVTMLGAWLVVNIIQWAGRRKSL